MFLATARFQAESNCSTTSSAAASPSVGLPAAATATATACLYAHCCHLLPGAHCPAAGWSSMFQWQLGPLTAVRQLYEGDATRQCRCAQALQCRHTRSLPAGLDGLGLPTGSPSNAVPLRPRRLASLQLPIAIGSGCTPDTRGRCPPGPHTSRRRPPCDGLGWTADSRGHCPPGPTVLASSSTQSLIVASFSSADDAMTLRSGWHATPTTTSQCPSPGESGPGRPSSTCTSCVGRRVRSGVATGCVTFLS